MLQVYRGWLAVQGTLQSRGSECGEGWQSTKFHKLGPRRGRGAEGALWLSELTAFLLGEGGKHTVAGTFTVVSLQVPAQDSKLDLKNS